MAKATKKQALGRGLSALLKDPENDIRSVADKNADKVVGQIVELELSAIQMNPFQPRSNFDDESLRELASSIEELGLIQPITVRKVDFDTYQLVSGERRYRASKIIGLDTIPAYIRIANDQESLEMALVENIQRQDLDPIEIALSYQRLLEEIGMTQEKLSDRVGKKRSTIANYLRLLRLDPIIQTGMRDGFISMGHGRALAALETRAEQIEFYEKIVGHQWSVRETEDAVAGRDQGSTSRAPKKKPVAKTRFLSEIESDLAKLLEADVSLNPQADKSGKIVIPYSSEADLLRLKKRISGD